MSGVTLIVMAAGLGSRYGGLKQIDPVGPHNATILDYAVYDALSAGFNKVVFVISKKNEMDFRERFGKTIEKQCETTYVFQHLEDLPAGFVLPAERQKPWGTAHAVLGCKDVVTTPFAVINADDFYGRAAFRALHTFLQTAQEAGDISDYCMVGYILSNTLTSVVSARPTRAVVFEFHQTKKNVGVLDSSYPAFVLALTQIVVYGT